MNSVSYRDMVAALRLTRAGDLIQATAALQRALRGTAGADIPSESNAEAEPVAAVDGFERRNVVLDPQIRYFQIPQSIRERLVAKIGEANAGFALSSFEHGSTGYAPAPVSQAVSGTTPKSSRPLATERGQFLTRSFTGAAGIRAYKLFIPSTYRGQPCPLIVMLHGCTQTVDDFATGTQMNELGDEMACLIAYPEQPASANPAKCWNWFRRGDQQRDSGEPSLVAGITRTIMRDYAVDPKRVYIAGMSAGAAAAAQIAAAYPDVYAALGVHSGLPCEIAHDVPSAFAAMKTGERQSPLRQRPATLDRAVPTIVFHGDRDGTVHPSNGDRFADDIVAARCDKQIRRGRISGGLEFTQTSYTNPSGQPIFEQWVVHGAGHAWSGGDAAGSYTEPRGPNASREMLRFFLTHQHSD